MFAQVLFGGFFAMFVLQFISGSVKGNQAVLNQPSYQANGAYNWGDKNDPLKGQ